MESLIAVAGTLLGGLLGILGSYFTQRTGYRRESRERLAAVRRQLYVEFLISVHEMFAQVTEVHQAHRARAISPVEASEILRKISPRSSQAALENLRLVASDRVAAAAADLWARMRRDAQPLGSDLEWQRFSKWRKNYWSARQFFIDAARRDIGFEPLDWSRAGVGPARELRKDEGQTLDNNSATSPGRSLRIWVALRRSISKSELPPKHSS
ncbi:putative membrane protein [Rhodococcus opacus]|uniref:Putative membrane protein n=1 Tax=Rhodococcus opacus TaxID=37919 RepID=A0A1B1K9U7_RHOOP|nr:putative membrane protein [Rhodococcus opacus]